MQAIELNPGPFISIPIYVSYLELIILITLTAALSLSSQNFIPSTLKQDV